MWFSVNKNINSGYGRRDFVKNSSIALTGIAFAPSLMYGQAAQQNSPQSQTTSEVDASQDIKQLANGFKQALEDYNRHSLESTKNNVTELEGLLSNADKSHNDIEYIKSLELRIEYEKSQQKFKQDEISLLNKISDGFNNKSSIVDLIDSYARAFEKRLQNVYEGQEQLQELMQLSKKRDDSYLKILEDMSELGAKVKSYDQKMFEYFFGSAIYFQFNFGDPKNKDEIMNIRKAHYQRTIDYLEGFMKRQKDKIEKLRANIDKELK